MKNYLKKKGFEFEVLMELCKSINYKKIFFGNIHVHLVFSQIFQVTKIPIVVSLIVSRHISIH